MAGAFQPNIFQPNVFQEEVIHEDVLSVYGSARAGIFQPNVFQPKVFQKDVAGLYGGIGHFLVEIERAKQLAKITRKTPAPIDRTSKPQFAPVGRPPIAPSAPVINLQAIQNERMAAQQQAAAQAATIKRRRQEAEILLLVG